MSKDDGVVFEQARILAEESINCASVEELWSWTIAHRESIDDTFFRVLDQCLVIDPRYTYPVHDTVDIARFVLDCYHQEALLQRVLQAPTFVDRHATLKAIIPKITHNFFRSLGHWADENPQGNEGIVICDDLLGLIAFNGLRDDWDEPLRTIIRGSAWFAHRDDDFFRMLVDFPHSDQPLEYEALDQYTERAALSQSSSEVRIGLAVLNVILAASSRAVSGPSLASKADEIRFRVLVRGARLIASRSRIEALCVFDEAQVLLARLKSKPMTAAESVAMGLATATFRNELGEIKAKDHPHEAIQLHHQALQYYEDLIQQIQTKRVAGDFLARAKSGRAHSLSRLADAEVIIWHLDEAADHLQEAIAIFRELGMIEPELAEYRRVQAKIAFLRTDFSLAEALLASANSVQGEEKV